MSPKKRQKKHPNTSTNDNIEVNSCVFPIVENNENTDIKVFQDNSIRQDQDEEYEMSIIMDIIRMQEKEDNERQEKEKQRQIEEELILKSAIETRDHNIKEILRKLKVLANIQSSFEKKLVSLLENTIDTQELHITIYDSDLHLEIQKYLGFNNNKGTIRLSDEVKEYAKNLFILQTEK